MNIVNTDGLQIGGYSVLNVWQAGLLPALMAQGHSYAEARLLAEGLQTYNHRVHNLIVSSGKALVGDMLKDSEDVGLTYHAIGTGTTAVMVGDTTLTTESARKAWTTKARTTNTVTYSVFYTAAQATANIKEAGIFGGTTASGTANSGTLFAHYLQAYDNSAGLYDLTFDYILTIG